jgi:hypothetical protein
MLARVESRPARELSRPGLRFNGKVRTTLCKMDYDVKYLRPYFIECPNIIFPPLPPKPNHPTHPNPDTNPCNNESASPSMTKKIR